MVSQTKVFIGSLPQGSRPEELRKLFEQFGEVTECDIMNRCGFVHMQTEEQAAEAIRALHSTTFNGAVITVERGRIKERGPATGAVARGANSSARGAGGGRGRGIAGGGRGGRGGTDRRGGGGGRGGHGSGRDAPYTRGRGGGMARNGRRFDRGNPYDDRNNGFGAEDQRGFALSRDSYTMPPPMFDDCRGFAVPMPRNDMYQTDMYHRRGPMSRAPMSRGHMSRGHMPIPTFDAPPRAPGLGDLYNRRAMSGAYDRVPYAQPYTPRPRGGGGCRTPRGGGDGGAMARY